MEKWKEYKIGDIAKTNTSQYSLLENWETIQYLDTGSITKNQISGIEKFLGNTDLPSRARRKVKHGDIVYSCVRPNLCHYGYIDNPPANLLVSTGFVVITVDPNLADSRFIYYFLTQDNIVQSLHTIGEQAVSTYPSIKASDIEDLSISLPPLPIQHKIASILKSFDDKIEVNRRINDNLEQQAQALFKSWFVDFEPFKDGGFVESELGMIPKGWRIVSLDEMTSKFGTGLNPRKNFKLGEGNNYYVTIKNMGNNRVFLDDKCDKVNDEAIEKINKRSKLQKGDLLFSGIGTIGRVALITGTPTNWNTSESVFNLHPSEIVSSEFLYILLLSDVFQQYVKLHAQGGVQQGIRMASLKEYKMAIPDDHIMREFDNKVVSIVSLVKRNDEETDRLVSLRDTLLPRLMSGELNV